MKVGIEPPESEFRMRHDGLVVSRLTDMIVSPIPEVDGFIPVESALILIPVEHTPLALGDVAGAAVFCVDIGVEQPLS